MIKFIFLLLLSFNVFAVDTLNNLDVSDSDHAVKTSAKVMVNGDIIFTTTGDVLIYAMLSECYTANDATASTIQYIGLNNTTAVSSNISGVSPSLANAPKGASTLAILGAITNAPVLSTASGIGAFPWGAIRVPGNTSIKTTIGVGSTTGTWKHYIRYEPLEAGATVVPAF